MSQSALNFRLFDGLSGPENTPVERSPRIVRAPIPTPSSNPVLKYLLYRWASVLFLGGLLAIALATTAWYAIPSKFTTSSLIRVAAEIPSLAAGDITNRADFATYLKTQAALIRSYGVLHSALLDPSIAMLPMLREQPDAVAFLAEEIKLDYQDGSELVRLQLSGDDANAITKVVNAVQDAYFREVVEDEQRRKKMRLSRIEETIDRMKGEVENRQTRSKPAPAKNAGQIYGPQLAANQVIKLREQLAAAESGIKSQEDRITSLQKRIGQPESEWIDPPNLLEQIDRDTDIQQRQLRMQAAQVKIDEYKRVYAIIDTDAFRSLEEKLIVETKLRDELRQTKMADYRKANLPFVAQQLRRQYDEAKEQLVRQRQQRREIDKQIAEYQSILDAETVATDLKIDYNIVEIQDRQGLIGSLIDRVNLLRIELDAPPRVRPLQPAVVPQKRDNRRQILGCVLAALLGFGLVGIAVVSYEIVQKRAISYADAQTIAPVLGVMPTMPAVTMRMSETLKEIRVPGNAMPIVCEAMDKLRGLLQRELNSPSKVIMIGSAREEDGKNFLAWQLAQSFHRGGERTLLIDFDLRQPMLHTYFAASNEDGVCDVLVGHRDVRSAIRVVPNGLAFLPAGEWSELIRRELVTDRLGLFLNHLRQAFDVIVVNTHPVLAVAETYALAGLADAVLLSVRKHQSRLELLARARDKITGLTPAVFGLVFSGANETECWN